MAEARHLIQRILCLHHPHVRVATGIPPPPCVPCVTEKKFHSVKFEWIPGHCNIKGNVEAGRLSGKAHCLPITECIPFSTGDIRSLLRTYTARLCRDAWFDERHKQSLLYTVDPHLSNTQTCLFRSADTLFSRLRFRVAFTRFFLYRIRRTATTNCACSHPREDVSHILLQCDIYKCERVALRTCLAASDARPFFIQKIIGPWSTPPLGQRAFIAFDDFVNDRGILNTYWLCIGVLQ